MATAMFVLVLCVQTVKIKLRKRKIMNIGTGTHMMQ